MSPHDRRRAVQPRTWSIAALALCVVAPSAVAQAETVSDTDVMRIVTTHCVSCHARSPTHESFKEPPNNIVLETVADLKRFAPQVVAQTVVNKAMPMGNQTVMTEDERQQIGAWIAALK